MSWLEVMDLQEQSVWGFLYFTLTLGYNIIYIYIYIWYYNQELKYKSKQIYMLSIIILFINVPFSLNNLYYF